MYCVNFESPTESESMFRNVSIFGRGFYQNICYFKSLMAVDRGGD